MGVVCFVFGSYNSSCRPLCVSGNNFADGWSDPAWHHGIVAFCRIRDAAQTRAWPSIAKLWVLVWLVQIASSPQYGDGCGGGVLAALGVFGSRTVSFTWPAVWRVGSMVGM